MYIQTQNRSTLQRKILPIFKKIKSIIDIPTFHPPYRSKISILSSFQTFSSSLVSKNDELKKDNQNIVYALIIENKNNKKVLLQAFFDTNTRKLVRDRSITYLELDDTLIKMFNGKYYLFFNLFHI